MWRPNTKQWWVIWIAYAGAVFVSLATMYDRDDETFRLIAAIVAGALLLVWRFSDSATAQATTPADHKSDRDELFLKTAFRLLSAQLLPTYADPKKAFGSLMTNTRSAGYVFGFHDGLLQQLNMRDGTKADARAMGLVLVSYKGLFGEQAGYALYSQAISLQSDHDFHEGRLIGGNEVAEFAKANVPPLGLGRMLILGMQG